MDDHYKLWTDTALRQTFAEKTERDFFRTETRFLERIKDEVSSVLDVGCASGRLLELLRGLEFQMDFMGIDIAPENVAKALEMYPEHRFVEGNAVGMDLGETFDLVNATGVFQHEPRTRDLLESMIGHGRRYVLFDVKFARIKEHLIDLEKSYCRIGDFRAYFVCFAFAPFLEMLESLPGVARAEIYGYITPPNDQTVVPEGLVPWVSAGILLTLGEGPIQVSWDLPEGYGR